MPTVFAVFEQTEALEQTLNALLRQEQLGRDFKVLTTRELEASPPALQTSTHRISAGVDFRPYTQQIRWRDLEMTLVNHGLSPIEGRFIAGLLKDGGEVLVWQTPPSQTNLLELLSDNGAVHVLALFKPDLVSGV